MSAVIDNLLFHEGVGRIAMAKRSELIGHNATLSILPSVFPSGQIKYAGNDAFSDIGKRTAYPTRKILRARTMQSEQAISSDSAAGPRPLVVSVVIDPALT